MWCPNCQADVAAEVSAENQRVRCATCSTEIQTGMPIRTGAKTEAARELLKKWANDDLFDPFGPLPGVADRHGRSLAAEDFPPAPEPASATAETEQTELPPQQRPEPSRPHFRFDAAHTARGDTVTEPKASVTDAANRQSRPPEPVVSAARHIPRPHVTPIPPPRVTFAPSESDSAGADVRAAIQEVQERRGSWSSFWGQILAYLGVAGLTLGTSLILWGYFGGPTQYTPTGWLIVTAGQMMLFLGVVTLVSGGMEQTTDEVGRRVERLGMRLVRIEEATLANTLQGPHTPAEQFTGERPDSGAPSQRARKTA